MPALWMKQDPKLSLVVEKWTVGTTTVARNTQVNLGPLLIWWGERQQESAEKMGITTTNTRGG